MRRALITGGAGFIGSHLATALLENGWRVRVFDQASAYPKGNLAHLAPHLASEADGSDPRLETVVGDVLDFDALRQASAGVDCAFHLAAMVSVPQSIIDPLGCHAVCATGTLHVLEAAKQAGVRRVVYAASSSAYGDAAAMPIVETVALAPLSPYAAAKLAGEMYCKAYAALGAVETVRLRYFNVFGARQDPGSPYSGVIALFTTAMAAGRTPTIYGDGLQTRDFIAVGDVARANLAAADAPGASGGVYNIGRGAAVTLRDLTAALNALLGTAIEPRYAEPRLGDVRHSLADVSAARDALGFTARTSFEQSLADCLAYYRAAK
ncbi:MAG: NAD-dependent epimerase/dehydratase family protein [Planctomycetia bacterium]